MASVLCYIRKEGTLFDMRLSTLTDERMTLLRQGYGPRLAAFKAAAKGEVSGGLGFSKAESIVLATEDADTAAELRQSLLREALQTEALAMVPTARGYRRMLAVKVPLCLPAGEFVLATLWLDVSASQRRSGAKLSIASWWEMTAQAMERESTADIIRLLSLLRAGKVHRPRAFGQPDDGVDGLFMQSLLGTTRRELWQAVLPRIRGLIDPDAPLPRFRPCTLMEEAEECELQELTALLAAAGADGKLPAPPPASPWISPYPELPWTWTAFEHSEPFSGAPADAAQAELNRALHHAVIQHDAARAKELLQQGADPLWEDIDNTPTCMVRCLWDDWAAGVSLLLRYGVPLNAGLFGFTPLMEAARKGSREMVRLLLRRGADVTQRSDIESWNALGHAAESGHTAAFRVLAEAGSPLDISDLNGQPLFHMLARLERTEEMSIALQCGLSVDLRDGMGHTALMIAAQENALCGLRHLLSHGADTEAQDADGLTPLMHAAQFGHTEAAALLLAHGADCAARNPLTHMTAADYAAYCGHPELARWLVSR